MPLIPALRRQRQVDFCEFEASLVYRVSSRTAGAVTQRKSVSKTNKQQKGYLMCKPNNLSSILGIHP